MVRIRGWGVLACMLMATAGGAWAQAAQQMRSEVLKDVKAKFAFDRDHVMAEMPELTAHLKRFGEPNSAGTSESPRMVWIVRVPGDTLGNCLRIDARKYNKNTPGLEFKVLTGKCEMYQREKLKVFEG